LAGFVVGFLLVEEREERILDAVAVTPRGTSGFLRHRTLLPAIIGGLASLFVGVATGSMSAGRLMVVATLAAGSATLVTLTMVAVARDRVQALAVSKLTGLLLVAAIAFQFVEGLWRLPLGAFPSTWIVEAVAGESHVAAFGIGSVTHLVAGGLLIGRVRRTLRGR
ncbi:MAG TPA: hypothetical protein VLB67_14285, partial [Acidimicrobiia bacterium]|nr:hypothetical protein [Acidimicrobiia bacterium]